jgi:hypothetical protein
MFLDAALQVSGFQDFNPLHQMWLTGFPPSPNSDENGNVKAFSVIVPQASSPDKLVIKILRVNEPMF